MGRQNEYTEEQMDYVREIASVRGLTNKALVKMFNKRFGENRTINAMTSLKSRLGIKTHNIYTDEMIDYLREIASDRSDRETTQMFNDKFDLNVGVKAMSSLKKRYGIVSGRDGRFKKGHEPWNKDMKGLQCGGVETQFKKGNRPLNTVDVGTEGMREDGYLYVKIAEPNVWKLKHHIVWEEVNGPIPDGYVILFGDKDRLNFDIDNLILISRAELITLNRHGLIQDDAELTKIGLNIAKVIQKVSKRRKEDVQGL